MPAQLKSGDVVRGPYAEAANSPIHPADFAAAAIVALIQDEHAGKIYHLTGPVSLTHREQVQVDVHFANKLSSGLEQDRLIAQMQAFVQEKPRTNGELRAKLAAFFLKDVPFVSSSSRPVSVEELTNTTGGARATDSIFLE